MGDTETLTVRVPKTRVERLNALAESTRRSKSDLTTEALAAYLAVQEWQVTAIEEALGAANAGVAPIAHDRVPDWLGSWGTADELPRPR